MIIGLKNENHSLKFVIKNFELEKEGAYTHEKYSNKTYD